MPNPIPERPTNPIPDPKESIIVSDRRIFKKVEKPDELWLPDARAASGLDEMPLEPEDDLDPKLFKPCPSKAPFQSDDGPIGKCAAEIANWTFRTYRDLIRSRLKTYNKYRYRYNKGDSSPLNLGRYRLACRLVCEQILRRDLPYLPGFEWEFSQSVLPVFEIAIEMAYGQSPQDWDYEIVKRVTLCGVVEVRQRRHRWDSVVLQSKNDVEQQEWSSSSSSSSSSEFDPG